MERGKHEAGAAGELRHVDLGISPEDELRRPDPGEDGGRLKLQNRREVHDVDALEHTDRPLLGGLRERPSTRPVARPVVIFYKLDPSTTSATASSSTALHTAGPKAKKAKTGVAATTPDADAASSQKEKLTSFFASNP